VVPEKGPFSEFFHSAIVALDGDRAPFATSGSKEFEGPVGFKVSRVDLDTKQVKDFIRNTTGTPASQQPYGTVALERPIDVKFGPDGALYILDFGRMENKNGVPRLFPNTGRIFKLVPTTPPATQTTP
jgi:glucose/arabinose dehydrogenase